MFNVNLQNTKICLREELRTELFARERERGGGGSHHWGSLVIRVRALDSPCWVWRKRDVRFSATVCLMHSIEWERTKRKRKKWGVESSMDSWVARIFARTSESGLSVVSVRNRERYGALVRPIRCDRLIVWGRAEREKKKWGIESLKIKSRLKWEIGDSRMFIWMGSCIKQFG